MHTRSNSVINILLAVTAVSTAILLAVSLMDPHGIYVGMTAVPGRVLLESFHLLAWWIPLYFLILLYFSLSHRPLTWSGLMLFNALHVPILTAATLVRLIDYGDDRGAPVIDFLISGFSLRGAILVTSLLLAVQSLLYLQLWRTVQRRSGARHDRFSDDQYDQDGQRLQLPAPREDRASFPEEMDAREHDAAEPSEPGDISVTLADLRRRMEPETEIDVDGEPFRAAESAAPEPEPPLPLVLRGRGADSYANARSNAEAVNESDAEYDESPEDEAGWLEDVQVVDDIDGEDPEIDYDSDRDEGIPAVALVRPRRPAQRYELPVDGVLEQYGEGRYWEIDDNTRDAAEVLRVTLEEFGIKAEVTGIRKGPVITMFEILPAPGVKLAKITNLSDNIALRLAASSVRIVAPIPGKHAVGIEIPNRQRHLVSFAELLMDDEFFGDSTAIPIALGKDISGEAQIVDLTSMPHVLIAGATGSGKSVCVNSIICSILYRRAPSEVKMILIDPKIVELKFYNDIPHLLTPVITDPKRAFQALQYLIYEMERRYSLLDSMGARDVAGYNNRIKRKNLATEPLPYIVVIIDEFADLMATSGKELESTVARLAAMSRAVGIHLVLATQRPSTDVITGLIKANIPARIAFMVASKVDSRIILDAMGADKLLGRGDMLYTSAAEPFPVRMQGAFLSEDEVERVVEIVKEFGEPDYIDDEIFIEDDEDDLGGDYLEDPLMEKAIEVVTSSRKASASYLQRRLKVGYNRAARMVEEMERMGLVGPQNGSKPRDVITTG